MGFADWNAIVFFTVSAAEKKVGVAAPLAA